MRIAIIVFAAALALAAASCGGGSAVDNRDATARGIITVKPGSGSTSSGRPCNVWFYDDGSSSEAGPIVKWEWKFSGGGGGAGGGGGEWLDASSNGGLLQHGFTHAGTVNAQLRLTDSLGNTGMGKIKLEIRADIDADRKIFVCDTNNNRVLRYHEWTWISTDPDTPGYDEVLESFILEADLDGDGEYEPLATFTGDPTTDPKEVDLDGDGVAESRWIVDAQGPIISICMCPSKSKEDVYVWKIKTRAKDGTTYEHKGHVTVLK